MAEPKIKLSRPNRLARRMIKTANSLNMAAELMAENVVGLQDASQDLIRLADEIEEAEKIRKQRRAKSANRTG